MESLSLDCVLRQNPDQVAAEMDGALVMLNIETGHYYSLNEAANFIWNRLANPASLAEVRDAMLAEFDVSPSTCEADLMRFVEVMLKDGLLQRAEPLTAKPALP